MGPFVHYKWLRCSLGLFLRVEPGGVVIVAVSCRRSIDSLASRLLLGMVKFIYLNGRQTTGKMAESGPGRVNSCHR